MENHARKDRLALPGSQSCIDQPFDSDVHSDGDGPLESSPLADLRFRALLGHLN